LQEKKKRKGRRITSAKGLQWRAYQTARKKRTSIRLWYSSRKHAKGRKHGGGGEVGLLKARKGEAEATAKGMKLSKGPPK